MKSFEEALEEAKEKNFGNTEKVEGKRASIMMEGILDGIDKFSSGLDAVHAGVMDGGVLGGALAANKLGKEKENPDEMWERQVADRWSKLTSGQQAYYSNPPVPQGAVDGKKEANLLMKSGREVDQAVLDRVAGYDRYRAEAWNAKIKRGTAWAPEKDQVPDPNGDPAGWAAYLQKKWNVSTKMRYNDDFDAYEQAMRDWAENQPYTA